MVRRFQPHLTWEDIVMTLFRLDASINPANSASRAIADIVESEWLAENPDGTVVRRNLGTEPLAADAWTSALRATWTPEADRTQEQNAAIALAAGLAAELRSADAVLLAVPLYNFGIPQHVKTWIDVVIAGADAGEALLAGKPAVLVVVRGGAYGAGTPREGWDHSTGYLRRIIADVWGADLTIVEREFTLVGVNPALDDFKELADQFKDAAHAAAAEAGKALATA
jgi:FMN-dependent NADH-azoreductase